MKKEQLREEEGHFWSLPVPLPRPRSHLHSLVVITFFFSFVSSSYIMQASRGSDFVKKEQFREEGGQYKNLPPPLLHPRSHPHPRAVITFIFTSLILLIPSKQVEEEGTVEGRERTG